MTKPMSRLSTAVLCGALAALLCSCGASLSDEDFICEETGEVVTDREHILNALGYHYDSDELLLEHFPEGTEPASYSVYYDLGPGWIERRASGHQDLDHPKSQIKRPFVPAHFQAFKRKVQSQQGDVTQQDVAEQYLAEFPECCRALAPRWVRENNELNQGAPNTGSDKGNQWVRDVWIIDDDLANAGNIRLPERMYRSSNLRRDDDLRRFLFDEIFQRGDTASTQCGTAFFYPR